MHGSVSNIVVITNVPIELTIAIAVANKRGQHAGGELALACHPNACPVKKQARGNGPPETTMATYVLLPLACGYLSLLSTTLYEGIIWGFASDITRAGKRLNRHPSP